MGLVNSKNEIQRTKTYTADRSLLLHICSQELKREEREEGKERKGVRESKRRKRGVGIEGRARRKRGGEGKR